MIYQEVFVEEDGRMAPAENRILPVRISSVTTHNDFHPVLLDGAEADRVRAKVAERSAKLTGGI
jgi:poly-gamma-glutamate synthesis protein (capsule biosynthesis protein)